MVRSTTKSKSKASTQPAAKGKAKPTVITDIIDDDELGESPEGFAEIFGERVEGWFIPSAGNAIQGILRDVFETESKFRRNRGDEKQMKKVYKIEVTNPKPTKLGATRFLPSEPDSEEETSTGREAKVGDLIGVDEKGWLKSLSRVVVGQEVWIACLGKLPPSADYPQGAWQYRVLAKPVKTDEVTGEVHS